MRGGAGAAEPTPGGDGAGRRRHATRVAAGILAGAFLVRTALVLATPGYSPGDARIMESADYHRHAVAVAAGAGYPESWVSLYRETAGVGNERFVPTAHRLPLFPFGLSAVYRVAGTGPGAWRAARLLEALGGTLVVGLIALLAMRLYGSRAGAVAGALAALSPALVVYGTGLLSEWLFLSLELGAVLAALTYRRSDRPLRWAALAGGLGGLAALTRLNGVVVLAFVAAALWTKRSRRPRSVRAPAVAIGVALLLVSPWVVRNVRTMGAFLPLSTGNGVGLAGAYNETARTSGCHGCWLLGDPAVATAILNADLDEVGVDRALLGDAADFIRRHPAYPLQVTFWNATRILAWESTDAQAEVVRGSVGIVEGTRAMAIAVRVGAWALTALAAAGIALGALRRAPSVIWLLPALLLLTLLPIVYTPRYGLPVEPFVIAVAAAGIVTATERATGRRGDDPGRQPSESPIR